MDQISFHQVVLTNGFWKKKEDLNRKITIESVWEQFSKSGRIHAFTFDWKPGMEPRPHLFWDSDVAKWMEGAANLIAKQPDDSLTKRIEWLIDQIAKNQDACGYFNIYFTVCEPDKRFTDRNCHELYCAGHLIEAAVAYYEATGKDRFLKLMMNYADYIKKVFMDDHSSSFTTPGHEEIELALVKLYRCTKEKRYLELALFFINQRGQKKEDLHGSLKPLACYHQSHLPVRQQHSALGHAVRACYLYCAMADLAYETNDQELLEACKTLFTDISTKKMYVTGGIGSTHLGEAFTVPYDLPNQTAYAETCAAIGLMLFARRMSALDADAKYQDVLERAMYNGMLSGLSLDGKRFFYENPLEINLQYNKRYNCTESSEHLPQSRRPEIFDCSCCPPNINRILSCLGDFCYGIEDRTVYVHQFMDSSMEQEGIRLIQKTNYPQDGTVAITLSGASCLKIRVPGWCKSFSINTPYTLDRGYAVIKDLSHTVEINFDMTPFLVGASPRVWENANRTAIQRGPMVYCLEGIDHQEENLHNLYIDKNAAFTEAYHKAFDAPILTVKGWKRLDSGQLYAPLSEEFLPVTLTMIPYYCFANRQESDLLVWLNYK